MLFYGMLYFTAERPDRNTPLRRRRITEHEATTYGWPQKELQRRLRLNPKRNPRLPP